MLARCPFGWTRQVDLRGVGSGVSDDSPLDRANPGDFDALLLPGGVTNPDSLRMLPRAVAFAKGFFDTGKPAAVICHGAPDGDRDWLREGKEDCFMPLRPGI